MSVTVARGRATPEELAAVLVALRTPQPRPVDPYAAWRAGRVAALRRHP